MDVIDFREQQLAEAMDDVVGQVVTKIWDENYFGWGMERQVGRTWNNTKRQER
jgi:hypothetical protein